MVEAILAGVLGAAVLAIVLIYRQQQRQQQHINQLLAESASQKLDRIRSTSNGNGHDGDTPPPQRRRGHLGLYIGGGVIAALAALGASLRTAWHTHRPAAIAAATTLTAGILGIALYYGSADDTGQGAGPPAPSPTASGTASPTPSLSPSPTPTTAPPSPTATAAPSTSRPPASPDDAPPLAVADTTAPPQPPTSRPGLGRGTDEATPPGLEDRPTPPGPEDPGRPDDEHDEEEDGERPPSSRSCLLTLTVPVIDLRIGSLLCVR